MCDATKFPDGIRLHFIDGLRGLAMLMVLLYHSWLFGGMWHLNVPLGRHHLNAALILGYGHIGVNLFLVLSGFCLYWPLAKSEARREQTLWGFARRRCRRILPPYYVVILATWIPLLFQGRHDHSGVGRVYALDWLGLHALMLHNTQPDYVLTGNGSLWSLGLEFQLYVLFPILVEAFRRYPIRRVVLSVFVVSAAYRFVVAHGPYTPDDGYGYALAYSVFGRCFEFVLGMFAAAAVADWHREGITPLRWTDFVFVGVIVPLAVLDGRRGHFQTLTDVLWGLLFAGLLMLASRPASMAHRLLSARWIVTLGVFSYSVYLIHLPLVMALGEWAARRHLSNPALVAFDLGLVVPLMLGLGYLFHLVFEKPFMGTPKPKARALRAPEPEGQPLAVLVPATE